MARNKNSTALFDVIHAAKKPPKASPSASIPTPRWWGKDKKIPKAPVADPTPNGGGAAPENVGRQQSWLKRNTAGSRPAEVVSPPVSEALEPPTAAVPAETAAPLPVLSSDRTESQELPSAAPEPKPVAAKTRFIDRFKSRAAVQETVGDSSLAVIETPVPPETSSEPLPMPVFYKQTEEPKATPEKRRVRETRAVSVDPSTGDIHFHLSYGGLVAIGFILLMALAIAFIAGTHRPFDSAMDTADSGDAARAATPETSSAASTPTAGLMGAIGPVKPASASAVKSDVMDVSPKPSKISSQQSPSAQNPNTAPTSPLPIKSTREIGMIYVVVQSYPDQDLAQKACDFVNHAGIRCTLVQGLNGWAPRDWYSVVGLQPFRRHDPGLDAYEKSAFELGLKFSNKVYNQFQPQGYTWREDSDRESAE
jgi:hypothetical protein